MVNLVLSVGITIYWNDTKIHHQSIHISVPVHWRFGFPDVEVFINVRATPQGVRVDHNPPEDLEPLEDFEERVEFGERQ